MTQTIRYRRAKVEDIRAAYAVFCRSLYDYLLQTALVDEETAKNPPVSSGWQRHAAWIEHLWNSAAENWVAEDSEKGIVGWAMSVARNDHLELTHCFVEPNIQSRGIGGNLLQRAFPDGIARHKAIIATQNPKAMALYLRSGVRYVTTSVEFVLEPQKTKVTSDLAFDRVDPNDPIACEAIATLEKTVLGYRRDTDTRFLLRLSPAWLVRRAKVVVGFAFGAQPRLLDSGDLPSSCGPVSAIDAADLPAILDHVITAAAASNHGKIRFVIPLVNERAVTHLLFRGARIDPFYVTILANESTMRLEHWVHTTPLFIM